MVAPSGYLKQGELDPLDHDPPALVAFAVPLAIAVLVVTAAVAVVAVTIAVPLVVVSVAVGGGITTHT